LIYLVTQGYCVKCKKKREMKGEKQITMKNGRNAISGTCSVCGTKMFKIGGGSGKAKAKKAAAKARPKKGKKAKRYSPSHDPGA
jgi:Domain of unknown function (DUF5679)